MKVTIRDIAGRANVSIGTVDRVLHNRGEVSLRTREKVLKIIEELNYQPDILARILKSKKNYRIAVLIPGYNNDNEFWKGPIEGIRDAASDVSYFGFSISEYLYDQFDKSDFVKKAELVLKDPPDAIILAPVYKQESLRFLDRFAKRNLPFLLINSNLCHPDQISFIGQDSIRSGVLAARLMSYGLPPGCKVLIINIAREKENYDHLLSREKGFTEFFQNRNREDEIQVLRQDITSTDNRIIGAILEQILKEHGTISGIFVTNSRVYKVARFLQERDFNGIRLIGYDLIESNVCFLKEGIIDFLISQKPREQGQQGLMCLFNYLVMGKLPMAETYIPIDIVTSENYEYYN